ncbi:hypothetical protein OS493_034157 [Desmophyllum pertusum]|uniref:Uncharacterized protein n=1 Tax=Desmophyllum pertusum TaxID=174260 RepID=A0A9X0D805_9CNID|nr:hypothetical protein OS493_034157 [Desmophyllum pertusum]
MAAFPNTLTVIFADHGHTGTPFSSTEEGRRELFDPSFFMIVPDGVAEKLGSQRMAALVENQKRFFILLDVHKAFMSLNDPDKMNSQEFSETGIFSVIPAKPHMRRLVHAAADQVILTQLKSLDMETAMRLVGKSLQMLSSVSKGSFILTTMDLYVVPPTGYEEDEVYKVSVKQYSKPEQGVFFLSFIRQTRYSKFNSCVDKSVDIKRCGCAKEQTTDVTKKGVLFENGFPRQMFGTETIVENLDSNCLLFMRTKLRNVFVCVGSGECMHESHLSIST